MATHWWQSSDGAWATAGSWKDAPVGGSNSTPAATGDGVYVASTSMSMTDFTSHGVTKLEFLRVIGADPRRTVDTANGVGFLGGIGAVGGWCPIPTKELQIVLPRAPVYYDANATNSGAGKTKIVGLSPTELLVFLKNSHDDIDVSDLGFTGGAGLDFATLFASNSRVVLERNASVNLSAAVATFANKSTAIILGCPEIIYVGEGADVTINASEVNGFTNPTIYVNGGTLRYNGYVVPKIYLRQGTLDLASNPFNFINSGSDRRIMIEHHEGAVIRALTAGTSIHFKPITGSVEQRRGLGAALIAGPATDVQGITAFLPPSAVAVNSTVEA